MADVISAILSWMTGGVLDRALSTIDRKIAADTDREKLKASMALALRKRPVTTESLDAAIDRIEERLVTLGEREVASDRVGELVMRELKKLDKIAYIRFASVYRNFEDLDEFSDAIREVKKPRVRRPRST